MPPSGLGRRWPESRHGRREAVPRHRQTAPRRCTAGSTPARDGLPRPWPRCDLAPGHPGTAADAGIPAPCPACCSWWQLLVVMAPPALMAFTAGSFPPGSPRPTRPGSWVPAGSRAAARIAGWTAAGEAGGRCRRARHASRARRASPASVTSSRMWSAASRRSMAGCMVSSSRDQSRVDSGPRRTEIRTRPRSQTLFSSPCRAAWSATGPEMTVWLSSLSICEALEPGRPALVEDPLDADLIAR